MSTHKYIDRICCVILAVTLVLTVLFMHGESLGIVQAERVMGYETRLFDTSAVHTIDIIMDDWDGFISTCTSEEYTACAVVIDNESYKNVAIRAKGNTSLTQVASYGNGRYSFKIEFDHYDSGKSYHGLDKLCLNNIIQDNTYIKDFLCYQMMDYFGADAPLCSFVYITVNGEDWGLYLAVEGIEDSFLQRNYGSDSSDLYKPDSQSGGMDSDAKFDADGRDIEKSNDRMPNDFNSKSSDTNKLGENSDKTEQIETQADNTQPYSSQSDDSVQTDEKSNKPEFSGTPNEMTVPGFNADAKSGMDGVNGNSDVSLIYSGDDYSAYSNIFNNAKTDITDDDKDRLIQSIKQLNACENIENVVDIDEVIRYFVVHNFVCNFDSYTGSMIHNYYLYENDGKMSMIPWDYNLAFGGFQGAQDATSLVNYPIDSPVSGGTTDSRPMLAWIFSDNEYTELYHTYFAEFISEYFDSGYFEKMTDELQSLISPYVEKDPTKFCTYKEFQTGIATLKEFCLLRAQSINGQLDGSISATSDGQAQNTDGLVDASSINISDMGTMNNGKGNNIGMGGNGMSASPDGFSPFDGKTQTSDKPQSNDGQDQSGDTTSAYSGKTQKTQTSNTDTNQVQIDQADKTVANDGGNGQNATETTDNGDRHGGQPSNGNFNGGTPPDMTDNVRYSTDFNVMHGAIGSDSAGNPSDNNADTWTLLGVCAAVLAVSIIIALLYKKRA